MAAREDARRIQLENEDNMEAQLAVRDKKIQEGGSGAQDRYLQPHSYISSCTVQKSSFTNFQKQTRTELGHTRTSLGHGPGMARACSGTRSAICFPKRRTKIKVLQSFKTKLGHTRTYSDITRT